MTGGRTRVFVALVAAAALAALVCPPPARATPKPWEGRYQMMTYASRKAGTSAASRQREDDFGATFTLATECSARTCVATVVDGPRPGNPTVPWPPRYTWNGSEWTLSYDWMWDCLLGTNSQKEWARATSFVSYQPQPDGSLKGTWHTDIAEGGCRGSVVMPIAAIPA